MLLGVYWNVKSCSVYHINLHVVKSWILIYIMSDNERFAKFLVSYFFNSNVFLFLMSFSINSRSKNFATLRLTAKSYPTNGSEWCLRRLSLWSLLAKITHGAAKQPYFPSVIFILASTAPSLNWKISGTWYICHLKKDRSWQTTTWRRGFNSRLY